MIHKTIMYQNKPNHKPAKKTIKLGTVEHNVVSPQEMSVLMREIEQLKRTVQRQEHEICSLRNSIRTISNRPQPREQQSIEDHWRGMR